MAVGQQTLREPIDPRHMRIHSVAHRQRRCRTPCAAPCRPESRRGGCRRRCCTRWLVAAPPLLAPGRRRRQMGQPGGCRSRHQWLLCWKGSWSCQGRTPGLRGLQRGRGDQGDGGHCGEVEQAGCDRQARGINRAPAARRPGLQPHHAPEVRTTRQVGKLPCNRQPQASHPPESANEVSVSAADSSPPPPPPPSSLAAAAAR